MRVFLSLCIFLSMLWAVPVTELLGKDYQEIIRTYGFPNSIFPVRQSIPDKDDVVFEYASAYMYLFNNRCYRVFFSSEYEHEIVLGVKIGANKAALVNAFGQKYTLENDGLVWKRDKYLVVAKMSETSTLVNLWFITKVEK
jgi:hypothetical protein